MKAPLHAQLLYLLDGFGAAWELVDAALAGVPGGGALVVLDGVDRAGVAALRGELAARLEAVRAQELALRLAAGLGAALRGEVARRLQEFTAAARTWWGSAPEGAAVPLVTWRTAAVDKFLKPVREALRLWERLNAGAAPPGVVLPLTLGTDGFARADLAGLQAELLGARDDGEAAEFLLTILRAERDATEARARAVLAAFLKAAPARLGAEHPAVVCAPRLYPLPGQTPEPVRASGHWGAESAEARLTWEASGEERLSHYEVRWCRGEHYDKKKERAAGRVEKEGPRVFLTRLGLTKPGAAASFRVYVVLTSENERGSAPVTVWRPAGE